MASREAEIRQIAGQLDDLLDELNAAVAELAGILAPPDDPADEKNERLAPL
jgi:hypothetical protein